MRDLKPNVEKISHYYNERYRNKALPFWQTLASPYLTSTLYLHPLPAVSA